MPFCAGLFYRYYDGGVRSFVYPTLLLHGLGGTHLSWPHNFRRIPGQQVYALDLPGHGLSEIPACCSMSELVEHVRQFTAHLGIYSLNLVGHSMGGAIAYEFARKFPDRIRSLTLISFGQKFHYTYELISYFKNSKERRKAMNLLIEKGFHVSTSKPFRLKILSPLQRIRSSVLNADCNVCDSYSPPSIHKPAFPIHLITGESDLIVPLSEVRRLKYRLENAQMHVLKDSGHMLVFEKSETAGKILKQILTQVLMA
jgi:pimeloyl-ACP methyl ester carboxylesterase